MLIQTTDPDFLILIKGAGDLASGIAVRLVRCGFPVAMTEIERPLMVRRTVSFGEAVYDGAARVEEIEAVRVENSREARRTIAAGKIPVLVDPQAACRHELQPAALVDAIMAKANTGTGMGDAPIVVAIGPGFTAGVDCHAVVETNRGHFLGRVIHAGSAQPDTGQPGEIGGKTRERLLRAPVDGVVEALAAIGGTVQVGEIVARVGGVEVPAETAGILRGMIRGGVEVAAGVKIGDIDPRAERSHCFQVSDKSLSIAGGVLEAILSQRRRTQFVHGVRLPLASHSRVG